MLLWRLLLTTEKVAFGGTTSANLRSLFCGRKFLKLLTRLTVGQAVPELPLSVDSKLELLLRAFVFAKFPYTYPYTHPFDGVSCIINNVTEAPTAFTRGAHAHSGLSNRFWSVRSVSVSGQKKPSEQPIYPFSCLTSRYIAR